MNKSLFLATALLCAISIFQSCKKEEDTKASADEVTAQDLVAHNDLSEVAESEIDDAITENLISNGVDDRGACATVTYAQPKGTWPNTITIDYGTGCNQPGGIIFKGKVIVNQSNEMTVPNAARVITYDNFFIENVQISGARTLTFKGLNASGQPWLTKTGTETLTFPDATVATRNIDHVRTMTEGYTTIPRADNVWEITGTDNGTNRQGNPYTVAITKPLVKRFTCPWLVSGVIEMTVEGKTRSLDFGDGACERDATLTRPDGTTREVKVRRRWWK